MVIEATPSSVPKSIYSNRLLHAALPQLPVFQQGLVHLVMLYAGRVSKVHLAGVSQNVDVAPFLSPLPVGRFGLCSSLQVFGRHVLCASMLLLVNTFFLSSELSTRTLHDSLHP